MASDRLVVKIAVKRDGRFFPVTCIGFVDGSETFLEQPLFADGSVAVLWDYELAAIRNLLLAKVDRFASATHRRRAAHLLGLARRFPGGY